MGKDRHFKDFKNSVDFAAEELVYLFKVAESLLAEQGLFFEEPSDIVDQLLKLLEVG